MPQITDLVLDDYITALIDLRNSHPGSGRWPVEKWMPSKGRHAAPVPVIAYKKARQVLHGARVVMQPTSFWQEGYDRPEDRGEVVVRV